MCANRESHVLIFLLPKECMNETTAGSSEKMGSISFIIPAYNEQSKIIRTLEEVVRTLENLKIDYEIIVVDDGSRDKTAEKARHYAKKIKNNRITVKHYPKNEGKGYALMHGVEVARSDLTAFLDADLDIHPKQIVRFLDKMKETGSDIVIGSKRLPGSKVTYPLKRRILSKMYTIMNLLLFGLPFTDTQVGFKLMKTSVIKEIIPLITVRKYAFDLELLVIAHKKGYRIDEVPIELDLRIKFGGIDPIDILYIFLDTASIYYRMKVLGSYD